MLNEDAYIEGLDPNEPAIPPPNDPVRGLDIGMGAVLVDPGGVIPGMLPVRMTEGIEEGLGL